MVDKVKIREVKTVQVLMGARGLAGVGNGAAVYRELEATYGSISEIITTEQGGAGWLGGGGGGETPTPDTNNPVVTTPGPTTRIYAYGAAGITHASLALYISSSSALDDIDGSLVVTNNLASHPDPLTENVYTVTYSAIDAAGNTGTAQSTITVTEAADGNNAPVVNDQNLSTTTGINYEVTLGPLTDVDGDTITYSATNSAEYSITTNKLTLNVATEGTRTIVISGSDGTVSDTGTLTIGVVFLNPNNPVVPDQLLLTVIENEDLSITLGPLNDADGDAIIYTAVGSSDFTINGRIMTFNSATVGSVTMVVTGNDSRGGTDDGTVRIDVTAADANSLPAVIDQNLNTSVGNDLTIILGPATDADGDNVTFAVTGSSNFLPGTATNEIIYNGPLEQTESLTVTASDGIGVDVVATITITVAAASVEIPTLIAYSGWSTMNYVMTGYNTAGSTTPPDVHNPSVYKMVGQMYLANNIAGYVDDFNFIDQGSDNINSSAAKTHTQATSSSVIIYSAYGSDSGITADPVVANSAPGAGSIGWIDRMVDMASDAEAKGAIPIMYQSWAGSTDVGTLPNALINSDQLQAKHGMLIIRTAEIMEELGNMDAAYITNTQSVGSVNFLPPVTHLYSGGNDTFHPSYGQAYVNALATFKCLTGISAADNLFEIPSGGNVGTKYGMSSQFIADIITAVDVIQNESIVNGLADGAVPIGNSFSRTGTQAVEGKINIPSASNLRDDTPIVASRMTVKTITGADFTSTDLTDGVFTFTPRGDLLGDTVVVFTYEDTTAQEVDITLTLNVEAVAVIPPQEVIIDFGSGNATSFSTPGNLYNHTITAGGKVINGIRQFNTLSTQGSLQDTDGTGIGTITSLSSGGLSGGGYGGNSNPVTDVFAPYVELDENGSAVLNGETIAFTAAGFDSGVNYRVVIGVHWGAGDNLIDANVNDVLGEMNANKDAHVVYDKVVKASSAGAITVSFAARSGQAFALSYVTFNKITDGTPAATPQAVTYTLEPLDIDTIAGETVIFRTLVSSESSGQWYEDDVLMNGETAFDLSVTTTAGHNNRVYKRTATNAGGMTTSRLATMSILSTPPTISQEPTSGDTRIEGEPFTVSAAAVGATTQKWQKDGVDIAGATNTSYSSNALLSDSGSVYTCIFTNAYGSTTTTGYTITVTVKNVQYWFSFGNSGGATQNLDAGYSDSSGNGAGNGAGGEAINWIRSLNTTPITLGGMWRNDADVVTDMSITYDNPAGGGSIDSWSNLDSTAASDTNVLARLAEKGLDIHVNLWGRYVYMAANDTARFVYSGTDFVVGETWRVQVVTIHYRENTNDDGAIDVTLNGTLHDTGGRSQPYVDLVIFDEITVIGGDGLLSVTIDPKNNSNLNGIRLLKV
jgi:hypothetical protein